MWCSLVQLLALALPAFVLATKTPPKTLQIGVKHRVECTTKSKSGDRLSMHYRGTLFGTPDEEFDSSYSRDQPFEFTLGIFDKLM